MTFHFPKLSDQTQGLGRPDQALPSKNWVKQGFEYFVLYYPLLLGPHSFEKWPCIFLSLLVGIPSCFFPHPLPVSTPAEFSPLTQILFNSGADSVLLLGNPPLLPQPLCFCHRVWAQFFHVGCFTFPLQISLTCWIAKKTPIKMYVVPSKHTLGCVQPLLLQ